MSFSARIITLYPKMFPGSLGHSLAGRALMRGDWSLEAIQLRDFGEGKHSNVDDTPSGGGAGMVLRADILAKAIDTHFVADKPRYVLSPRGRIITQSFVREKVIEGGVQLICGRFEGIDQRVIDRRNLIEISVGDFILSGGEVAAMCLLDACVRLLPGVMGSDISGEDESFEKGLLEYDHYTRPTEFEGVGVPDVLTSGNHLKIAQWRQKQAEELTKSRRPDLWAAYEAKRATKKPRF